MKPLDIINVAGLLMNGEKDGLASNVMIVGRSYGAFIAIIKLPSHIGGRRGGLKSILPSGYRNHLFWSTEKMEMVRQIIEVQSKA